ncbi:hypothetical protein ACM26V_14460 [Salipaludibacillus sp. HK11]|uniref:hypothetical protein n=1 Tax=Salipaludibacillus sp. HK11 TaxID=3394320 RepID=UPI0039FBF38F
MLKQEFNHRLLIDETFDHTSIVTQLLQNNIKSPLIYNLCRSFYLLVYNSNIIKKPGSRYECYISDDSLIPAASDLNEAINYLSNQFQVSPEEVKNELFYVIKRYYTDTATKEELNNQFRMTESYNNQFQMEVGSLYEPNQFPNWDRFEQRVRAFV